jgi:DNA-directed RNA polymerase subunit RPC12/RpoP
MPNLIEVNCRKCGAPVVRAKNTRLAVCDECARIGKRTANQICKARAAAVADEQPCVDCGAPVKRSFDRGPIVLRCQSCSRKHKADVRREYDRKRYIEKAFSSREYQERQSQVYKAKFDTWSDDGKRVKIKCARCKSELWRAPQYADYVICEPCRERERAQERKAERAASAAAMAESAGAPKKSAWDIPTGLAIGSSEYERSKVNGRARNENI